MSKKDYDFSGWATVHNVKCSDGRIIHEDAFKDNDGKVVPLVYNHEHNELNNVLGHALLENRKKGVYAFCSFNETDAGKKAKELVRHGDISALSIYANKLVQQGSDVTHGSIKEVSLVLAGANPGAYIDNVMAQSEVSEEEAYIYNQEEEIEIIVHAESDVKPSAETPQEQPPKIEQPAAEVPATQETTPEKPTAEVPATQETIPEQPVPGEIHHKDDATETVQTIFDTLSEKQKNTVYAMIGQILDKDSPKEKPAGKVQHKEGASETLQDVYDTLTEKQKAVVTVIIAEAIDQEESNKEGKKIPMKHNLFDTLTAKDDAGKDVVLTHTDFLGAIKEAKKGYSLRDAIRNVYLSHSISNIENLFPDYKEVSSTPKVLDENNAWAAVVMAGIKHVPFSRIKSSYFDITGEEARARGYIKGNQKLEEVITNFKRTTDPQTVYKLQKFDRDDVLDMGDFDVVSWIKTEMRGKLEVELARAFLFGDGRSPASNDKIDPLHIRPIVGDTETYTTKIAIGGTDAAEIAPLLIDEVVVAQEEYKGSGNLTAFVRTDIVCRALLLKDTTGYRIYKNLSELATAMAVNRIVKVPASVMGSLNYAVVVDLSDYNVGADKGGQVSLFDDFDINFNKMEYLIETRVSGALVTPFSAMVFGKNGTASSSAA